MTASLRTHVFGASLIVACFAAAASIVLTWTYVTNVRSVDERARLTELLTVQQVADDYILPVGRETSNWQGLDAAVDAASDAIDGRVVVTAHPDGRVLADSSANSTTTPEPDAVVQPAFDLVLHIDEGAVRDVDIAACAERCFSPIEGWAPPVGLDVEVRRSDASSNVDSLGVIAALAGVLVASGGLAALLANRTAKPLVALASSAASIGEGDLRARVDTGATDRDTVALANAFNEMAAKLEQSELARTEMIADVAHELRNPISNVIGNIEAAQDRVLPMDESLLSRLHAETSHLARLTDDLQQLALADAGRLHIEPESVDLAHLIAGTVVAHEHLARQRDVALQSQIDPVPSLTADPTRLQQVVANLVKNALMHTPPGGTVRVVAWPVDEHVRIEVVDTGVGLTDDEQHRVFDRFWRADASRTRATGGAGIGLAICRALVEAHAGTITVRSEVGVGSTFSIELPRSAH